MRNAWLSVVLAMFAGRLTAQADVFPPPAVKNTIAAVQIRTSLRVDGVLDEPEWRLATPSPHFTQVEPDQGQPSRFATTVRVLYNAEYLYVGVYAEDPEGKRAIRATDFKRDFDYLSHDLVTLTFDGFNDERNAMCFATNAYGVQRDYLAFDDLYFDVDWDGLWRVRTTRTDSGWYAEFAIPWQTLRYPGTSDSVRSWGFNVYRNRRLTNEISAFAPFPRTVGASRMEYAGRLTNLRPPPPRANVRVQPYLLTSADRYTGTTPLSRTKAKLGGDAKWAINPNDVLDLTANTDFAQADADLQVNNITRFSVFFPERRQFFLENASLFSPVIQQAGDGSGGYMHLQPFFSRAIGLDTAGNPIPIVAGTRFVSRSSNRNYGAMLMRQDSSGASPAANLFVGRYSANVGARSRLGGLMSVKNTDAGTNVTGSLDGLVRLTGTQSVNTILSRTSTTGAAARDGFAGAAQYYNSTTHYKLWLTQSVVTKDFDPQMGFVSRTDVIGTTPGMNWYYRGRLLPFPRVLRAFEPGFLPEWYWQESTGKFIERTLNVWPVWLNFQNGAYFGYGITPAYQHLTTPFAPLGVAIAPGSYRYDQQWIMFTTNPSRVVRLVGDYKWGGYFDGRLQSGDWKLQFAPIPYVSVTPEFNRNHFVGVGSAPPTTVDLRIVQARLALDPRLQLTGFYQNNSLDHSNAYNVRFSWEYLPLSYLYVIYNHGRFLDFTQTWRGDEHLIVKLSVLSQL